MEYLKENLHKDFSFLIKAMPFISTLDPDLRRGMTYSNFLLIPLSFFLTYDFQDRASAVFPSGTFRNYVRLPR